METVTDNGTTYRKASVLAREFRYTPDYLGQLCRAKKVDARLVGRTWYVNPDSLEAHKQQRYRSTRRTAEQRPSSRATEPTPERLRVASPVAKRTLRSLEGRKHFYQHTDPGTVRYVPDDTELVPQVGKKRGRDKDAVPSSSTLLPIGYYEAADLPVTGAAETAATFAAVVPEPATLSGDVRVASAEDTELDNNSDGRDALQNKVISDDEIRGFEPADDRAFDADEDAEAAVAESSEVADDDEEEVQPQVTYAVAISHEQPPSVAADSAGAVREAEDSGVSSPVQRSRYRPRYRQSHDPARELHVVSIAPETSVAAQRSIIRFAPAVAVVLGLIVGFAILSVDHVLLSEGGERDSRFHFNSANVSSIFTD